MNRLCALNQTFKGKTTVKKTAKETSKWYLSKGKTHTFFPQHKHNNGEKRSKDLTTNVICYFWKYISITQVRYNFRIVTNDLECVTFPSMVSECDNLVTMIDTLANLSEKGEKEEGFFSQHRSILETLSISSLNP